MTQKHEQQFAQLAEMLADKTIELIAAQKDIEWYKKLWLEEKQKAEMTTADYIKLREAVNAAP